MLAYSKDGRVRRTGFASNLPDDPFFGRALKAYFPQVLTEKFADAIAKHLEARDHCHLHRNTVINRTGPSTFINFLALSESAAPAFRCVDPASLHPGREIFRPWSPYGTRLMPWTTRLILKLQLDLAHPPSPSGPHAWILSQSAPRVPTCPTLIQRYQPAARNCTRQPGCMAACARAGQSATSHKPRCKPVWMLHWHKIWLHWSSPSGARSGRSGRWHGHRAGASQTRPTFGRGKPHWA